MVTGSRLRIAADIIQVKEELDRLRAENQRLREALKAIVGRGTQSGPGAAVCVSMTTLVTIARQALEVSDE